MQASLRGLRIPSQRHGLVRSKAPSMVASRRAVVGVKALLELHQSHAAASSLLDHAVHHANVLATLADDAAINAAAAVTTAAAAATTAVADAATAAAPAATAAAPAANAVGGGPFDGLAQVFESILQVLDDGLEKLHVPYSYGFSIILLTILVKLATFPLTQKQVQSTVAIQALQPRIKELQAKHASEPETLQLETARLYRDAGVNPLAGCLPTLATIPVFIGLYRALTLAAQDNLMDQDFFWIPSLSGPASLADQAAGTGMSWLFPFVNGAPPIGWGTAGAYLVMPVLLIISQFISQKIISPPQNNDPSQAQTQAILKFLPLMIGWFSLNVPAGLTLYWFVNNILSTAQQLYLKKTTKINVPELATNPNVIQSSTPYIAPKEEKVKRVSGKDVSARRRRDDGMTVDVEAEAVPSSNGAPAAPAAPQKGGKGDKFRARKAREAAAEAAKVATAAPQAPPAQEAPAAAKEAEAPKQE